MELVEAAVHADGDVSPGHLVQQRRHPRPRQHSSADSHALQHGYGSSFQLAVVILWRHSTWQIYLRMAQSSLVTEGWGARPSSASTCTQKAVDLVSMLHNALRTDGCAYKVNFYF